ncbi:MAG: hypothetical protein CL610_23385 [Anaerolineaceae bacterium]|nr:hypothetical protein [Anaerolineaceae bacterium]
MKWLVMVLLLLGVIPATVAQQSAPPLIVWSYDGGFLQVYDGTSMAPLDTCAPTGDTYTGFPITFSPDGSHFAYLGLTNNLSRIYVCNVQGRTLVPVAGQEAEKIRSMPAWSPDNRRMAWNQVNADGSNLQTIVYDFELGAGQVVYERAETSAAFVVPNIAWGASGLALYDMVRLSAEQSQSSVTFINPDSGEARSITLDDVFGLVGQWATQGGASYFVLSDAGTLTAIDPNTDAVVTLPGRLEIYNSMAGDASLGLSSLEGEWAVFGLDFSGALGIGQSEASVTIAPDGQRIAFVTFESYPYGGKVYVMSSFDSFPYQATAIPGLDSAGYGEAGALYVFWGPTALRIRE